MCPGSTIANLRGGFTYGSRASGFYAGRDFGQRPSHRDLGFGARQRFAVTADRDTGSHSIHLDEGEVATVAVDADGNTTITIENKPGTEAAPPAEPMPVEASLRGLASRVAHGIVSKMSWERDPATGGVLFTPDSDETLHVEGDSVMAVVTTEPKPAG
jgi:hypothetical protein